MAALKARIVEIRQQLPPGGQLAKACNYTLGQWTRLKEILKDGQIEIDNDTPVMPPPDLCRVAA